MREGVVGDHGDGAYSVGRGGAANIGAPGHPSVKRNDNEFVPTAAVHPSSEEGRKQLVGRGGQGNVEETTKPAPASAHPVGLADKLKGKLFRKASKTEK